METKDIILELRLKNGLSQDEMAEKLFVTRQAVSRWERGNSIPNADSLKLISKEFGVSVNTLLGSPRQLICQCCGVSLQDDIISKDEDGFFCEDYCVGCQSDGDMHYYNIEELLDHNTSDYAQQNNIPLDEARQKLKQFYQSLKYWK